MSDLIKIETNEKGEPIVNARELHKVLEVKTAYKDWFPRMCEYGFTEGLDFCSIMSESTGGRPENNHAIKLDMAKEISMLQRTEKGKEVRKYFIQVEKDFNSPEKVMARALKYAEEKLNTLQLENTQQKQIIGELKPKADYTDTILHNKGLVTITAIAKDYGMSAKAFNKKLHELKIQFKQSKQWFLYEKYHNCGYTHSETVKITHSNGKEDIKMNTKWTQKGRLFLYELLKKNGIVPVIEKYKLKLFTKSQRKKVRENEKINDDRRSKRIF